MTVERAHINRRDRYARWATLLDEELQVIAKPNAHVIAIGRDVKLRAADAMSGFARFSVRIPSTQS